MLESLDSCEGATRLGEELAGSRPITGLSRSEVLAALARMRLGDPNVIDRLLAVIAREPDAWARAAITAHLTRARDGVSLDSAAEDSAMASAVRELGNHDPETLAFAAGAVARLRARPDAREALDDALRRRASASGSGLETIVQALEENDAWADFDSRLQAIAGSGAEEGARARCLRLLARCSPDPNVAATFIRVAADAPIAVASVPLDALVRNLHRSADAVAIRRLELEAIRRRTPHPAVRAAACAALRQLGRHPGPE